jgi:plastocyanin
MGIKFFNLTIH